VKHHEIPKFQRQKVRVAGGEKPTPENQFITKSWYFCIVKQTTLIEMTQVNGAGNFWAPIDILEPILEKENL
jgi:hypothetical protein